MAMELILCLVTCASLDGSWFHAQLVILSPQSSGTSAQEHRLNQHFMADNAAHLQQDT
jgi:hypothetical protein